jgi:hypothetical protein
MLKLKEGKEYSFLVEKDIKTPDNKNYFVVMGPDKKRYLLPGGIYTGYNIRKDSDIICKVDKINCSGEVFLEPRNPWYTEGEIYNFRVMAHETRTGITGSPVKVIVVTDLQGNYLTVPAEGITPLPRKGKEIPLRIERITKGKLYLVNQKSRLTGNSLILGREYEFIIDGIGKGVDDTDYLIISDPFGIKHTIPREHYEYYGFTTGTRFKGKIVKFKTNGEKTIEPENPFYKAGSVVRMKVSGFTQNTINDLFTVNLVDEFGFEHCVEMLSPPELDYVHCKVKMIKKGRPLLLPL